MIHGELRDDNGGRVRVCDWPSGDGPRVMVSRDQPPDVGLAWDAVKEAPTLIVLDVDGAVQLREALEHFIAAARPTLVNRARSVLARRASARRIVARWGCTMHLARRAQ